MSAWRIISHLGIVSSGHVERQLQPHWPKSISSIALPAFPKSNFSSFSTLSSTGRRAPLPSSSSQLLFIRQAQQSSLRSTLLKCYSSRTLPAQDIAPSTSIQTSRHLFNRSRRKRLVQSRSKTSFNNNNGSRARGSTKVPNSAEGKATKSVTATGAASSSQSKNLLDHLPNMQRLRRPTKEELLSAATGFWSRLRIRFKWFSIRSLRPFNMDDISAFFSWFLLGHLVWIIVGTTTFFSLLIFAVNTVFAQETLARWVGNYLTKSSGVKVIFESAIVPKWKDGVISFRNVFVSRRPGQQTSSVRKGSQTAAAAAAAELASERATAEDEDTNYTQYDLSIETVNVTLSFTKWFNGHGLLRDVEVKGIRGVIDRTAVHWDPELANVDPLSYRHTADTGDFELESFAMDDLLVSVYQPDKFRPFSVSIFSADLPRLRKQWLFYDFLSANHVSGSFDGSLFTVHPRQTHNHTGTQLMENAEDPLHSWKKQSRIRIDALKIDHLNRGVEGPFSWIHEGNVDIVADILFPTDSDESIAKVVSDFYDRVEAQVLQQRATLISSTSHPLAPSEALRQQHQSSLSPDSVDNSISLPPIPAATSHDQLSPAQQQPPVILDLTVTLTSVHAAVPLFPRDLSYINAALIRPIVAYINSHSSPHSSHSSHLAIPISARVVKPLSDFEGSWTLFDSGLMQDLSRETYEAFARSVTDEETRGRRMRKVGVWGVGVVMQALILGLAGGIA